MNATDSLSYRLRTSLGVTASRLGLRGAALALVAAVGCGGASAGAHAEEGHDDAVVGQTVPDLKLAALHGGKELRTEDLRGNVVLLDIWASWCGPCKEELPMLDAMAGRLGKTGVEIVAVSIDDSAEDAEGFLKSKPSWAITFAHDPEGKSLGILQPPKMPSSFVIDANGVVRDVNAGFERGDADKLEARLVELSGGASGEAKTAARSKSDGEETPPPASAAAAARGPTSRGSIDGQPFAPKLGHIMGKMHKDGRVAVSFTERTDCTPLANLEPGSGVLTVVVPWKEGYQAQLGAGKRSGKHKAGAISFARMTAARKPQASRSFKPMGTLAVVSAPKSANGVGKVTLDVTSGDYRLVGDFDVDLCGASK
jgi:thiol-disulfide isomerase/thioredoxin